MNEPLAGTQEWLDLVIEDVWDVAVGLREARLAPSAVERMRRSRLLLDEIRGEHTYGVNTGFGRFVSQSVPATMVAGQPYSAVIVKAGSIRESDPDYQVNTVFMNPTGGTEVFADVNRNGISDPGGQGGGLLGDKSISHIILCVGEGEFEEVAVTTTTSTTSTTVPATTTTHTPSTTSPNSQPSLNTTTSTTSTRCRPPSAPRPGRSTASCAATSPNPRSALPHVRAVARAALPSQSLTPSSTVVISVSRMCVFMPLTI